MAKGWINNKSLLRVLSLVIAVALWLYVVITQDPQRTNKVDAVERICGLNQYQINEGLTIVSKSADNVSFAATGKRSLVTGVRGTYYARLVLDNVAQPGKYNFTPEISKPDGVYVSNVNPSVVEVYIDKYVSSLVPVNIKTTGTLKEGLIVKKMASDVQQVSVTLPSLALEQISYIGVTIDLSTISSSTTINCVPVLYDKDDNPVNVKNSIVEKKNIAVDITAEKTKTVTVKPAVRSEGLDLSSMHMQFSPQTVDIYGDVSLMDTITSVETEPLVLTELPEEGGEYRVKLSLPPGIHLKEGDSEEAIIIFKK